MGHIYSGYVRVDCGVIWGAQGKEAALLDCQRRLREAGRCE